MIIIHVYNLFPWISERKLHDVFSIFGPIEEASISRVDSKPDERVGRIIFRLDNNAREAVKHLSNAKTKIGNPLRLTMKELTKSGHGFEFDEVSRNFSEMQISEEIQGAAASQVLDQAQNKNLVFVKNFKDFIDEDKLKSLFGSFGGISGVSIKRENGKSLGYGFVDFEEHKAAVEAIKAMHGTEICGRKIFVAFAEKKSERAKVLCKSSNVEVPKQNEKIVLYVKHLPKEFSSEDLRALFSRCGLVSSVSVKASEGGSKSVGFVCYESPEAAKVALKEMNGIVVKGNKLEVIVKK